MKTSRCFMAVAASVVGLLLLSPCGALLSRSYEASEACEDSDAFEAQLAFVRYRPADDEGCASSEASSPSPPADPSWRPSAPSAILDGPQDSPWPMQSFNNRHVGRSPYGTADTPGVEKWRFQCKPQEGGITVASDGTIYFGEGPGGTFYALHPNGTLKWKYKTGGIIWSSPAIAEDGTIYVGNWDWKLYAFNPDGTVKWCTSVGGDVCSSPAIAPDGTIYLGTMYGSNKGDIVAVASNGTLKWRYATGYFITSDPAIGDDGTVYIGSGDTYVYAMHPNGTLRWRFKTGAYVKGPPSIADDGTVYIGSWDGYLYALSPDDGTMLWRCKVGSGTETNPSIGPDGTIYVGGTRLFAVNPNGTLKWELDLGPGRRIFQACPAVCADGIIYVGTEIYETSGGEIVAVNPDGTERWRKYIANDWVDSSPAIAADGTVYIGSSSTILIEPGSADSIGYLHAFGRGPLNAHANGPYDGYYQEPVSFIGEAYGGEPLYTYHWDFGDGTTSEEQSPTHAYDEIGNYTATLSVHDSSGNESVDQATVTISYAPPTVTITKPGDYIYFMNVRIIRFMNPLVIGPITVTAEANQIPFGIDRVEFTLDGALVATDTQAPYAWTWIKPAFLRLHTIIVTAYDTTNAHASAKISFHKYF